MARPSINMPTPPQPKTTQLTRRRFLQHLTAAGTTIALPDFASAETLGTTHRPAPNSRIHLAMIGMGRQAYHANLLPFLASPDTQVVAVCDVDHWRARQGLQKVEEFYAAKAPSGTYQGCQLTSDFRDVLDRPDVDAVMISTPDHWHAIQAIQAAKAGKDVALEKPISLSIHQGRAIANALHHSNRIFRTDTEVRFASEFRKLCQHVRNGRIGRVQHIIAEVPNEASPVGPQSDMPIPDDLHYELWLGPAPKAPYTEARVHPHRNLKDRPGWMIIRDTCDGIISNWGAHLIDIVQWGNSSEYTGPVEIEAHGQFHPQPGLSNALSTFHAHYRYANGVTLDYRLTGRPAVRFEGTGGWIEAVWWKGLQASSPDILDQPPQPNETPLPEISEKVDFIQSVKNRTPTLIPAEVGHRTTTICQLGLISILLGRKLHWDPQGEHFENDPQAENLLDRPLRPPWTLA